jgi:hypothetical protein
MNDNDDNDDDDNDDDDNDDDDNNNSDTEPWLVVEKPRLRRRTNYLPFII